MMSRSVRLKPDRTSRILKAGFCAALPFCCPFFISSPQKPRHLSGVPFHCHSERSEESVLYPSGKVCVFSFVVADGLMPRAQRRSSVKGPRTSTFRNSLRYSTMQNGLVRDPPQKKQRPRTMIFCNSLSFNKIQIWLVRGPLSRPSPPDSSLALGMTFLVILNRAPYLSS